MLFHKHKKSNISDTTLYGFSFPAEPSSFSASPVILCTLKALLVFCATFGTLGGLLSAFSVPYHTGLLMGMLLLFSFILAFLHYNSLVFNTVYPLIFVFFSYSIIQCRYIANSGFQFFISALYEEYSSYFNLSLTREVTVSYHNQYLAITVAAIFVGFFLAMLLNIAISTYMSLFLTLLLTFPFLQIAIYIEHYPNIFYLFLILFSYVSIGILGRSQHFDLPLKKKKRVLFQISEMKDKKNVYTLHNYKANGPVLFQTIGVLVFISSLFMGLSYSLLTNHTEQQAVSNGLKSKTDEYVKIFVQSGFSGFFDRYSSTGGISGGKLGGVSSVRPDYQTDLRVTFAPYSYDTIYLKAFTGADYTGSEWLPPSHSQLSIQELLKEDYPEFLEYSAGIESKRLAYLLENSHKNLKAKMEIKNIDASPDYFYLPYYTESMSKEHTAEQSIFSGSLPTGETLEVSYYPPVNAGLLTGSFTETQIPDVSSSFPLNATEKEKSYFEIHDLNNQVYYKSIPTALSPLLDQIRDEIGTVETLEDQILLIQDYFRENYAYTTNPVATPINEDFVNYFLTSQKRGYCAHFASAAVLLFRSYGYPARYAEGYVITFQDMSNGQAVDKKYEEYLEGTNPLGRTGVIEADITDGNAHAWVEVYKEGFGWIPVEVTPPSSEGANTYSDFWDVFSGFFSVSEENAASTNSNNTDVSNQESRLNEFLSSTNFVSGPVLLLAGIMIFLPALLWFLRKLLALVRIFSAFQKGNYIPYLSFYYRQIEILLQKKGIAKETILSPAQMKQVLSENLNKDMSEKYKLNESFLEEYKCILEEGCFSQHGISKKQALIFKDKTKLLKQILNKIK